MIASIALSSVSPSRIARLFQPLVVLVEARSDAAEFKSDVWEFALAARSLYREGLNEADLRWLIAHGLVEQALEEYEQGAKKRVFRPVANRSIPDRSCIVLTHAGGVLAKKIALLECSATAQPLQNRSTSTLPCWDANTRELTWRGLLVKQFRTPAHCQEIVLNAFEKARWTRRIDNPLPMDTGVDPMHKLRDTLRRLNDKQFLAKISFSRDGKGTGICWAET